MEKKQKKNWARTSRYKELKDALLQDLQVKNLYRLPYTDLVDQYMSMWCQLQMLYADINDRGVYTEYQNGRNQNGTTDNKSVGAAIRLGARMDDILETLGYKDRAKKSEAAACSGEDDEL